MKFKSLIVISFCIILITSSCNASTEAIANTSTPSFTETPMKTHTPPPTATIESTPTDIPTEVPTETPVPEPTHNAVFIETDRGMVSGKMTVTYTMVVTGFEPNENFIMEFHKYVRGDLGQKVEVYSDGIFVRFSDSGKPITLGLQDFSPGEPHYVTLINADGIEVGSARTIPFPLEIRGQDECVLSIIIGSSTGEIFLVEGEGFESNEEIEFISVSEGETIPSTISAEPDGTFENVLLPAVIGKDSGNASIAAKGMKCDLYLDYSWGAAAFDQ